MKYTLRTKGVNKLCIADFTLFMIKGLFDFTILLAKVFEVFKYIRKVFNYKYKYIVFKLKIQLQIQLLKFCI